MYIHIIVIYKYVYNIYIICNQIWKHDENITSTLVFTMYNKIILYIYIYICIYVMYIIYIYIYIYMYICNIYNIYIYIYIYIYIILEIHFYFFIILSNRLKIYRPNVFFLFHKIKHVLLKNRVRLKGLVHPS